MEVFAESNYKSILKLRVKELSRSGKTLTLQSLAKKIPVQSTYLSKSLNDEKTHLNEDHLFRACQILEFLPDETDYIFLLRSHDLAQEPARKSLLQGKIHRLRTAKDRTAALQEFGTRQLAQDMAYLFEPMCVIVHAALSVPEYAQNPRKLASILGLSPDHFRLILQKIEDAGYVRFEEGVAILSDNLVHYGTDHPLMRIHQSLLRQKIGLQMQRLSEADKHCFMGTFSADDYTFEEIKTLFKSFMKDVEKLVVKAPSQKVFQIGFDLFRWT